MNGYVHDFLTEMARQAVEVTVAEANSYGQFMGGYLVDVVGEFRLPVIGWQLEADLAASKFVPQPQRKLS